MLSPDPDLLDDDMLIDIARQVAGRYVQSCSLHQRAWERQCDGEKLRVSPDVFRAQMAEHYTNLADRLQDLHERGLGSVALQIHADTQRAADEAMVASTRAHIEADRRENAPCPA